MSTKKSFHAAMLEITAIVYSQPPSSMHYPCILYKRASGATKFAGNRPYTFMTCYDVTVIDTDPDSEITKLLESFPMSKLARNFASDNLHHDVFTIYY